MYDLDLSQVAMEVFKLDPDRRRANHLLKVCAYAAVIGEQEGMSQEDLKRLKAAALLHDVGIKAALEKHGSASGKLQQEEGPPIARELLERLGCSPLAADRVCWLIAHHHEYDNIRDLDYQILVEADFLVNCDEGGMSREQIGSIRDKVFRTTAGAALLGRLFQV